MNKYFVPVKNVIGDYFVVENLNKQTYVFKLDGSRIKTTKQKFSFPFQTIDYDTSHYLPVNGETKLAELVQQINDLPRYNNKLLGLLKIMAKTEKREFTVHELPAMTEELAKSPDKYKKEVAEMINFFKSLEINKIVTPLAPLCKFLEDDLKTTDARYGGTIFDKAIEVDKENKKMTNTPKTAKKSIALLIAIPLILILVGIVGYQAYELGVFDNLGASFGGGFGAVSDDTIKANCPNAEAVVNCIDSGKYKYDQVSKAVQSMYDVEKARLAEPRAVSP